MTPAQFIESFEKGGNLEVIFIEICSPFYEVNGELYYFIGLVKDCLTCFRYNGYYKSSGRLHQAQY